MFKSNTHAQTHVQEQPSYQPTYIHTSSANKHAWEHPSYQAFDNKFQSVLWNSHVLLPPPGRANLWVVIARCHPYHPCINPHLPSLGETANGQFPDVVVSTMAALCQNAEEMVDAEKLYSFLRNHTPKVGHSCRARGVQLHSHSYRVLGRRQHELMQHPLLSFMLL